MVVSGSRKRKRKAIDPLEKKNGDLPSIDYLELELLDDEMPAAWTNFGDLPTSVQLMILEMLPTKTRIRLEVVSRTWRALLLRSWSKITSVDIPSTITKTFGLASITDLHVCGYLAKSGPYIRRIEFYIPGLGIGGHVLHSISQRCPQLQELHLISDMKGHTLSYLLRNNTHFSDFPRLHTLNLTYTCADTIHNGMRHLFRMMTKLTNFRLDFGIFPPSCSVLFPHCPDMKEYSVNVIRVGVNHVGIKPDIIYEFFTYLAGFYRNLEILDISLCYLDTLDEERMYSYLQAIGTTRPIRRLNFGLRTPDMTSDQIWFGRRGLQAMSYFQHLEHLSLVGVYIPKDFHEIILPTLKSLRLSVIQNIGHKLLVSLASGVPNLDYFHLTYGHSALNNEEIKAHTIVAMLKLCRKMSLVELNLCNFVEKHEVARHLQYYVHDCLTKHTYLDAPEQITINFQYTVRTAAMRQTLKKALGCCGTIDWQIKEDVKISCFRKCRKMATDAET